MFGLITGSGFYDIPDLDDRRVEAVETPFGSADVTSGHWRGRPIAFVARHGSGHSVPPSAINYRANIWALKQQGVDSVLATAVSGGINPDMGLGALVVISDVLNFTSGRADTFFDGSHEPFDSSAHHVDMTHPYSPELRGHVLEAARLENVDVIDGGVYCTADGPRFETPAEINMMRTLGGDLVGMTGYPEVVLAVEAGMRYASIGIVSNPAAAVGNAALTANDVFEMLDDVTDPLHRIIDRTISLATESGTLANESGTS